MTRQRQQPHDSPRELPRDPVHEEVIPPAGPERRSPELEPFSEPDMPKPPEQPPMPI